MLFTLAPTSSTLTRSDRLDSRDSGHRVKRHSGIRRFLAAILMLLFAVSSFESLIADVHDGDAPPSKGVAVVASGGPAFAGASCRIASVESVSQSNGSDAHASCNSQRAPAHDYHVCHCAHAHTATLSRAPGMLSRFVLASTVALAFDERMPASADRAPSFRPPVALQSA